MLHRSFNSFVLIIVGFVFLSNMSYAQKHDSKTVYTNFSVSYLSDRQFTEKEIGNLLTGIESENLGLRKSAIYLSGLYEISETVPALINQLKKEENTDVKVLIALVLFKIEDPRGVEAVENLFKKDVNAHVKRMSKAILDEFKNKLAHLEISER